MTPGPPEFPGTYPGTIKPIPDCAVLTHAAALVCIGDVVTVRQQAARDYRIGDNTEHFAELQAAVRVRHVLKGRAAAAIVNVAFLRAAVPTALEDLAPGERALLFLIRDRGLYRFADPVNGKFAVTGRGPYRGSTPIARIVNAVAAAVRSKSSASSGLALHMLAATDGPEAVGQLRRLAATGPRAARREAVISLLRRNPRQALPLARGFLRTRRQARGDREEVQREIARWLGHSDPAVRRAAVQMLEASARGPAANGGRK